MTNYIPTDVPSSVLASTTHVEWAPSRQQAVAYLPESLISASVGLASTRDFTVEYALKSVDKMSMVLRDLVREQRKTNALLERLLATAELAAAEIEIRDIPDERALEEIRAMFETATGDLYYSDIAEELCLPLPQVVRVCATLMDAGLVGVAGSTQG